MTENTILAIILLDFNKGQLQGLPKNPRFFRNYRYEAMKKSRDSDHLQNLVYDRNDVDVERWIEDVRQFPILIPPYTYDVYTRKGKKQGRTKAEFFREEYEALRPRVPGLFDDLVPDRENNLFDYDGTAQQ